MKLAQQEEASMWSSQCSPSNAAVRPLAIMTTPVS